MSEPFDALRRRIAAGDVVKICGLREPEHAAAAAEAGADLLGFIFAPARRQVTPEAARVAIEAARDAASGPIWAVGVFVDAPAEEIARVVEASGIDVAQLHGHEPPGLAAELPVPTTKAFRPAPGVDPDDVLRDIQRYLEAGSPPLAALVDGYHPTKAGGEGVRADWDLARALALRAPLFLAGGLDPGNVADAIASVRPAGVDVSSGVEIDGVKDADLIARFVANARQGFASVH